MVCLEGFAGYSKIIISQVYHVWKSLYLTSVETKIS